jgi:alkylation response protein AidB-like acyl-CoA dehydrogenase
MLARTLFTEDHDSFRDAVRRFMQTEVAPHHARWEEQGFVDRELWLKAGAAGYLCPMLPEEFGGSGVDAGYSAVVMEEVFRIGATGLGFSLHSDIVAPYILHNGSEALKATYLPKMARGEMIGAIAMTEPGAGSDLQGVRTTAVRDGDHYLLNGSKTFITNGFMCDLVIVVAKTDPNAGSKGISLFVVDTAMPGFNKGKRLHKMGMSAQDTSELFFDKVRVPAANLLGEEGRGFVYLMQELPWERLQIAITAMAASRAALEWTVQYAHDRKAFKKSIIDFQTVAHTLADVKTEIAVGQAFVDRCLEAKIAGTLDATTASMAKYWASETQFKIMDRCVQIHGGYGYMHEYPIARAWADARVQRIYGGTNEIMKELISRSL